jgi:hypothetical protein
MRNRRAKSPDALARLFLDVTGELPDDASLLRMRRVSGALSLRDNDALWSMIAVLEYYARLYEAMPDRIRRAGDGSFDAVRREAEAATDALMRQHRDALARCKASIAVLADRLANRVAGITCNRFIGAAAVAAREQRARMDGAVGLFERAMLETATRAQASIAVTEGRLIRTLHRSLIVAASLCVLLVAAAFWMGEQAK